MFPVVIAALLDILASSLTGTDLILMLSIPPYLQFHNVTSTVLQQDEDQQAAKYSDSANIKLYHVLTWQTPCGLPFSACLLEDFPQRQFV